MNDSSLDGQLLGLEERAAQHPIPVLVPPPHKPLKHIAKVKTACRLSTGEIPTPQDVETGARCTRCCRLKVPCQYESSARRGRRPKSSLQPQAVPPTTAESSSSSQAAAALHALSSQDFAAPSSSTLPFPSFASTSTLPFPSFASTSTFPYPNSLESTYSPSRPYLLPPTSTSPAVTTDSTSQASPATLGDQTAFSLAEAAESRVATFRASPFSLFTPSLQRQVVKLRDPVELGIINLEIATQLHKLFLDELNQYIILLDPRLHTIDFVRSTSSALFAATLAVASKFYLKELYPALLPAAQQLASRGMGGEGEQGLGLVQALLILSYWKEPFDSSQYIKVGMAIRLGQQLGLHKRRKRPLPPNEIDARVQLDGERTWITLICFDDSCTLTDNEEAGMTTGRYVDDLNVEEWLAEIRPFAVDVDEEQPVSVELIKVYRLSKSVVQASSTSSASVLGTLATNMLARLRIKYLDPSSPSRPSLPAQLQKARFHVAAAAITLARASLIASSSSDVLIVATYLQKASELADVFEELAREGFLTLFQDLTAYTMLAIGESMGKLVHEVDVVVQAELVRLLNQIYTAAFQAKDGNEDSVAGFISRFYRAVLTALHGPGSNPETRPPSPRPVGEASSLNPFDQLLGMETELFTDLDTLIAELSRDNSYWDSINPFQASSSLTWLDATLLEHYEPALQ